MVTKKKLADEPAKKRIRYDRNGRRYTCELCLKANMSTEHHTICDDCDRELKTLQAREDEKRRMKISHRKCRLCAGALEQSRYFSCRRCIPDSVMESEDDMEQMFAYKEARAARASQPVRESITKGTKVCKRCNVDKPVSEFSTILKQWLRPSCKPCTRIENREYQQRARTRLQTKEGVS
jgi:hypothetical protein